MKYSYILALIFFSFSASANYWRIRSNGEEYKLASKVDSQVSLKIPSHKYCLARSGYVKDLQLKSIDISCWERGPEEAKRKGNHGETTLSLFLLLAKTETESSRTVAHLNFGKGSIQVFHVIDE